MRIRLYMDEDVMSRGLVKALRTRGAEIVVASEIGMSHKADEEHLAYAAQQGLVLYTYNTKDYMALHVSYLQEGKSHSGLIFGDQQRYSIGEQMRRLLAIVSARSAETMQNQVEFLSAWG
jgi:predicted nuclease of predicted toxin-antitoxin system